MQKIVLEYAMLVNLAFTAGYCDDRLNDQSDLEAAKKFVVIEDGQSWAYKITVLDNTRIFECKCEGGDVRDLDGVPTRYQFIYGRTAGYDGYVTKSIYAMAQSGPREFFVDDFAGGILHDPPVPLLPQKIELGATWNWRGQLARGDRKITGTATLEIKSVEQKEFAGQRRNIVRVLESLDNSSIQIERCFARDVGLVSYVVTDKNDRGQRHLIVAMELVLR